MIQILVDGYKLPTRLDRFLKHLYPNLTQGLIERGIRKSHIKINNLPSKSNARVQDGDLVMILDYFSQYQAQKSKNQYHSRENPSIIALANKILTEYKIAETSDFIIINKPHSLATQNGSKISISIDSALKYLYSTQNLDFKLTHRLDKNTSGLLLIAKTRNSAVKITKAFADKLIQKEYLSILEGIPQNLSGTISSRLIKMQDQVQEHSINGKISTTRYQVISISQRYKLSLVSFYPLTGRTHQLRVHSKQLRCPILGDTKYGNKPSSEPFMFLHAQKLIIPADVFDKEYIFIAPLPIEFQQKISQYFT